MKIKLLFLFIVIILAGCNLISPKNILIQNDSEYDIAVKNMNADEDSIFIKKKSGNFILTYDQKVKLFFIIEEIGYEREIHVNMDYLEKKKLNFNLEVEAVEE